jgi:hypothetical protein
MLCRAPECSCICRTSLRRPSSLGRSCRRQVLNSHSRAPSAQHLHEGRATGHLTRPWRACLTRTSYRMRPGRKDGYLQLPVRLQHGIQRADSLHCRRSMLPRMLCDGSSACLQGCAAVLYLRHALNPVQMSMQSVSPCR